MARHTFLMRQFWAKTLEFHYKKVYLWGSGPLEVFITWICRRSAPWIKFACPRLNRFIIWISHRSDKWKTLLPWLKQIHITIVIFWPWANLDVFISIGIVAVTAIGVWGSAPLRRFRLPKIGQGLSPKGVLSVVPVCPSARMLRSGCATIFIWLASS